VSTRILLNAFQPLDGDLVRRLVAAEPDMEIVGTVESDEDLIGAVSATHADVVIVSTPASELTDECRRLLAEWTRLRVFTICPSQPSSVVELRSHTTELPTALTPTALVDTIRRRR